MADNSTETPKAALPILSGKDASAPEHKVGGEGELAAKAENRPDGEVLKGEANGSDEPKVSESSGKSAEVASEKSDESARNPAADVDTEMRDAAETTLNGGEVDTTVAVAELPAVKGKGRRKSTIAESKTRALNKKGSKARLTHIDARPGDHFLVKLKGFPAWPAIICEEDMLPQALINSRPISAARPDGYYTDAYADGGKRVNDRSFPVMYLYTNEFGWVSNTALSELTADKASDSITEKMRKDLKAAFELAAKHHSVEHYKEILKSYEEELIAQEEARKEAAATPKKFKKGKTKASDEDEDMELADVDDVVLKPKSKKRKAEDDASPPQRPNSVKKPKIKLNTSSKPKTANGITTPKGKDVSATKTSKTKAKKSKDSADKKAEASKEAKLTPEERRARKEKEVLYLRHKLQRGLLTREQQPQEDEMESMSGFIAILENFNDLEVSIIRATKINKVLKAILKLDSVPREEHFGFKKRSQSLLDRWNKLLAGDGTSAPVAAPAKGINGTSKPNEAEKETGSNGVKEDSEESKKAEPEKATGYGSEDTSDKAKIENLTSKDPEKKSEKADDEAVPSASEPVQDTA